MLIKNNTNFGVGGGLHIDYLYDSKIINLTLYNNTSLYNLGGGLAIENSENLRFENLNGTNNMAKDGGGISI